MLELTKGGLTYELLPSTVRLVRHFVLCELHSFDRDHAAGSGAASGALGATLTGNRHARIRHPFRSLPEPFPVRHLLVRQQNGRRLTHLFKLRKERGMKNPSHISPDGQKALNSLPPHYRPRRVTRLTPDGLRALQSMPAHYHPRQHRL